MEYAQISLDTWQRMAEGWNSERKWVWESSRIVSEWMVQAIDPRPGQTILEIACGAGDTGFAAAAKVEPTGRLISTDFAPNMVEAARRQSQRLGLTNVEHRVLDAHAMDLADGSVDGVLCRWGFMLMEEPAGALNETRRVLRKGGRLAFSVWGEPAANPWAAIPGRVLQEHTEMAAPPPDVPGIFAMADPTLNAIIAGEGRSGTAAHGKHPDDVAIFRSRVILAFSHDHCGGGRHGNRGPATRRADCDPP